MSTSRFYISTGAKSGFYTLRQHIVETHQTRTENAQLYTVERDYFIKNLSTDKATAIAKAREFCGRDLSVDFDLDEITRREASEIDYSIFQAGKYSGKSIHEVKEIDPNYLIFMAEKCTAKSYAKTIELIKSLMAYELETRSSERSAQAADLAAQCEINKVKFAPVVQDLAWATHGFVKEIREQLAKGELPHINAMQIIFDIVAKGYGRRNSKAYNAKLDELHLLFYPEDNQDLIPASQEAVSV